MFSDSAYFFVPSSKTVLERPSQPRALPLQQATFLAYFFLQTASLVTLAVIYPAVFPPPPPFSLLIPDAMGEQ